MISFASVYCICLAAIAVWTEVETVSFAVICRFGRVGAAARPPLLTGYAGPLLSVHLLRLVL
jgi:hypothetical protein